MGLGKRHWSSGGDPSCLYDSSNGGHWFFTEFVSASPESKGGPFAGCFAAVAEHLPRGHRGDQGLEPVRPVQRLLPQRQLQPDRAGLSLPAQRLREDLGHPGRVPAVLRRVPARARPAWAAAPSTARRSSRSTRPRSRTGLPVPAQRASEPAVTVAYENMGLLKTPNGTCFSDNKYFQPGIACWFGVIPARRPDPGQFDNSHGGTGFMLATLDFYSLGGNQLAVFDWTGLRTSTAPAARPAPASASAASCSPASSATTTLRGPISRDIPPRRRPGRYRSATSAARPGSARRLSTAPRAASPPTAIRSRRPRRATASCGPARIPRSSRQFASSNIPEEHMGAAYWVVGTSSFDKSGQVHPDQPVVHLGHAHEDLEFPAFAAGAEQRPGDRVVHAERERRAAGADSGGFFPSSAFGRLTSTSARTAAVHHQHRRPGPVARRTASASTRTIPSGLIQPRWGDYGNAIYMGGKVYFASEYIQYPNCKPPAFTLTVGTCGGTRDGFANWGTSVNSVTP